MHFQRLWYLFYMLQDGTHIDTNSILANHMTGITPSDHCRSTNIANSQVCEHIRSACMPFKQNFHNHRSSFRVPERCFVMTLRMCSTSNIKGPPCDIGWKVTEQPSSTGVAVAKSASRRKQTFLRIMLNLACLIVVKTAPYTVINVSISSAT